MTAEKIKKILGCDHLQQLSKYIVSNAPGTTFGGSSHYRCHVDDVSFFVKLVPYNMYATDRWTLPRAPALLTVDAEIYIMRAIKTRIIDAGYSPHFPELLAVVKCEGIARLIEDKERCRQQQLLRVPADPYIQSTLCNFEQFARIGTMRDKIAITFSEYCDMGLVPYVQRFSPIYLWDRERMLISIAFQVYYSLVVATRVWKTFRHGDLAEHNIMMKIGSDKSVPSTGKYLQYRINGRTFNVPFFGAYLKIIDFGHGQIAEEGIINSQYRVGWTPDHIFFIINYEKFIDAIHYKSDAVTEMFKYLNPMRLASGIHRLHLISQADTFCAPEAAFEGSIFSAFETRVRDEDIIGKYTAPRR